ncbi:MAG: hypothetical protein AB7G06_03675, partial [Bdellovibrionales bacterium]
DAQLRAAAAALVENQFFMIVCALPPQMVERFVPAAEREARAAEIAEGEGVGIACPKVVETEQGQQLTAPVVFMNQVHRAAFVSRIAEDALGLQVFVENAPTGEVCELRLPFRFNMEESGVLTTQRGPAYYLVYQGSRENADGSVTPPSVRQVDAASALPAGCATRMQPIADEAINRTRLMLTQPAPDQLNPA